MSLSFFIYILLGLWCLMNRVTFVNPFLFCCRTSFNICMFFQTVGVVLCSIYVVHLIGRAISKRGKKDNSISKISKSYSEEAAGDHVAEPDISRD